MSSATDAEPGPSQPEGFRLPRRSRLLKNHEFRRVYRFGRRLRGRHLLVIAHRQRTPTDHRLGLAVSKEHGRAVRRNKIKRIFREAFRLTRPDLPGAYDIILIPQKRPGKFRLEEVRRELRRLIERAPDKAAGAGRRRRPGKPKARRSQGK